MPIALHSFILEPKTRRILVRHTFYGETEAEADKWKEHHLETCEYFRSAEEEDRTIEIVEEIDELPDPDALEDELEEEEEEPEEGDEDEEEEEGIET